MERTKRIKRAAGAKGLHGSAVNIRHSGRGKGLYGASGRAGRTITAVSSSGAVVRVDRLTGLVVDRRGKPHPRFLALTPIPPGRGTVQVQDRHTGATEVFKIRTPSKFAGPLRTGKGRTLPGGRLNTGEDSWPALAKASARRIADAVVRELAAKDPTGALLRVVADDPTDFAERVADQVDTAPLWSDHLGPVYSAKSVRDILGVSKQAVHQNKGLLRMTTGDGTVIYPAFQFAGTAVVPGVAEVVRAASGVASDWLLASWFVSPNEDLGGRTPISELLAHGEVPVVAAAHGWLGRLAS